MTVYYISENAERDLSVVMADLYAKNYSSDSDAGRTVRAVVARHEPRHTELVLGFNAAAAPGRRVQSSEVLSSNGELVSVCTLI